MRNQYKVLSEKYTLVLESSPGWDIQPTDKWYEVFEAHKLPHFKEFIYWLNNYSKEWARNEMFGEVNFNRLKINNVDDLLEHIYDDRYRYAGDDPEFAEVLSNLDEDEEDSYPLRHEIATRNTIEEVYYLAFLPWYKEKERLAALNKDNPGIEMDI